MGLLLGGRPYFLCTAFDVCARQQGLIGVHGSRGTASGQSADAPGFSGIGVSREDCAFARVIDPLGLPSGLDHARAAFHNLPGFPRGQVENRDAPRRGVHQFLAIGSVAVLVEVEARAAGSRVRRTTR